MSRKCSCKSRSPWEL